MSNCRVTIAWSAVIISAATLTGSFARCGADPCPPVPFTVTISPSLAAMSVPGRVVNWCRGSLPAITCTP